MLTKSFSSMVCSRTPPQALKNISLKQNKPLILRVAYLIHYLEKWRRSLWCRRGRVEATAVTMCHGKPNCWPINSVNRFNLKVPARPINAKHTASAFKNSKN